MSEHGESERRFGPDFVAEHRRRYGKRPPEARQLTYDIAVNDEYASWRRWLDEQLDQLPGRDADVMARKVWLDEHFWTVNFELAAGAGLRAVGLDVAYEQAWNGITPDWTVLSEAEEPAAFVEVHTDDPPQRTFAQMRGWHGLVERIKKIPVPVVLQLAATGVSISPPDAGTAKKIAQDIYTQIVGNPTASVFRSSGYTFLVAGDPRRGGQPMVSPLGMHAAFDPPSSRAGAVGAEDLMKRIEDKARKYRELAEAYGVPLIVAVGAHRFTGMTLGHLDDALTGMPAPKMTFQFNAGDTHIGEQTVTMGPVPPWAWPEGLGGLLWIDNELPFRLTARPNPRSHRQIPPALLSPSV